MNAWNRGTSRAQWKLRLRFCIPLLLLPLGLLLSFLPKGDSLLTGCSCLLLVVSLQIFSTRREWMIFTGILLVGYCGAAQLLHMAFHQVLLSALLLAIFSLVLANQRQLSDAEQQLNHQEDSLNKQLSELNRNLMSIRGMDAILNQLMRDIEDTCGYPSAFFSVKADEIRRVSTNPPGLILYDRELQNIRASAFSGKITGVGTCYCIHSVFRCYPVFFSGQVCGVMAVLIGVQPQSQRNLQFLDALANRGFIAMERQQLVDTQAAIMTEKQVEEARSNFLFAISHDFRTPLTAIMGACAELEGMNDLSQPGKDLAMAIREESAWLAQMIDNLLSITRMNASELNLALNDEVLEEIVGDAAAKCTARYPSLKLNVVVSEEVMVLRVDATLIIQVILNLVENAVKYAADSQVVELSVFRQEDTAVISVRDHGRGVPADELDNLFQAKALRSGDTKLGLGIGLSICKTIVEAHGGKIWAENRPEGGADFRFSLPLEVLHV